MTTFRVPENIWLNVRKGDLYVVRLVANNAAGPITLNGWTPEVTSSVPMTVGFSSATTGPNVGLITISVAANAGTGPGAVDQSKIKVVARNGSQVQTLFTGRIVLQSAINARHSVTIGGKRFDVGQDSLFQLAFPPSTSGPGPEGPPGPAGSSLFTLAVENGFAGTELEWMQALVQLVEDNMPFAHEPFRLIHTQGNLNASAHPAILNTIPTTGIVYAGDADETVERRALHARAKVLSWYLVRTIDGVEISPDDHSIDYTVQVWSVSKVNGVDRVLFHPPSEALTELQHYSVLYDDRAIARDKHGLIVTGLTPDSTVTPGTGFKLYARVSP